MKKSTLLSFFLLLVSLPSLATVTIGVLPYKITYEGRIPKKFTPEQLETMKKQDGASYQRSMIIYLGKMGGKRKNQAVDAVVLSQGQLSALLTKNNISELKLDSLSNEQLAKILGVTHIIRGSATRNFIMSDDLSAGITAVSVITGQPLYNATAQINVLSSLEDATTNNIVVSKQYVRSTSATRSDEQSLRDAFRKSSRKMFKQLREE